MAISPTIQNSGGAAANMEDVRALASAVTGSSRASKTSAYTIVTADHGKTIVLNSATGFVVTLPALADGFFVRVRVGATPPTSGNHTVVTPASANIIEGSLNTAAAAAAVSAAAADTVSFVASAAVLGDWAEFQCDGTNWFVKGSCLVATGMTTTQAS